MKKINFEHRFGTSGSPATDRKYIEEIVTNNEHLEGFLPFLIDASVRINTPGHTRHIPQKVKDATHEQRQQLDRVQCFIDTECRVDMKQTGWPSECKVKVMILYDQYRKYCDESGFKWMNKDKFSDDLLMKGFKKSGKQGGNHYYLGLEVVIATTIGTPAYS